VSRPETQGTLTPIQVGRLLGELTKEIGDTLDKLRDADYEATRAKVDYDRAYAVSFKQCSGSVESRRHMATEMCHGRRLAAEEAAVRVRDLKNRIKLLETRIDVGRSYGAALRAEAAALPWQEGWMARTRAAPVPPQTRDCSRESIKMFGVVHPVVMNSSGDVVDGNLRMEVATELGVQYLVDVQDSRIPAKTARTLHQNRLRKSDEHYSTLSGHIVALAGQRDDDGVGIWPQEVIAAALGVSTEHVLDVMRRHLRPGAEDVRDLFPARRRTVDGEVVDAVVTTVEVEPLPAPAPTMPPLHEVLQYVPESSPVQLGTLRASLEKDGQRKPILLSPQGQLVDGRARWRLLTEMGITPDVQVVTTNPWEASLKANVDRFDDIWDRLLILAHLPARPSATVPNDMRQPTVEDAAHAFRVTTYSLRAFRMIVANATPELIAAVTDEVIKIGTAIRMMREMPREHWGMQVEAMRREHSRGVDVAMPMRAEPGVVSHNNNRTKNARTTKPAPRTIAANVVITAIDALDALGMVLDGAEGLDPRITREQAADLLSRLSTSRRPLGRLNTMLKQRKETT
jgi:hypothetical protein